MTFQAIPAIDVRGGKVVRLNQGDYEQTTTYNINPLTLLSEWALKGVNRVHIVDLDAAKHGSIQDKHTAIYDQMIRQYPMINFTLGGGIRSMELADHFFDLGFNQLIMGTVALKNHDVTKEIIKKFPHKIYIGIDQRKESIATDGWLHESKMTLQDVLNIYDSTNCAGYIFTDIYADGTLRGIDVVRVLHLAKQTKKKVIFAGGVGSTDDIFNIQNLNLKNVTGVIVGKALYENKILIEDIIA